jgi:hypothetical protein
MRAIRSASRCNRMFFRVGDPSTLGYCKGVKRVLQGRYEGVTGVLQVLQGCYKGDTKVLQRCYKG